MSDRLSLGALRGWAPVPTRDGGIRLRRWILLDGNRHAVTGALSTLTIVSILALGEIWTFEIRTLLSETPAVQTVLSAFLSGIILLVSIVVSINSIVLSYDLTSIDAQETRIEGVMEFRQAVGHLSGEETRPTDPESFLRVMSVAIREHAHALEEIETTRTDGLREDRETFVSEIAATAETLEDRLDHPAGGEFGVLWLGLDTEYGPMMNRLRRFTPTYHDDLSESEAAEFEELMELFKTFATGREYFKTLYYSREISDLSRTLLVVSLPSIIVTVWALLAVNGGVPEFWLFGLPPLLTFVAVTFTVALVPFLVLTAYMLRVATVTRATAAAGPFVL